MAVARLATTPDLTLRVLVIELRARGVTASYGSVWRTLRRAGISFKKTLFATEQDRPDVARRRARWKAYQGRLDPSRLVFIDETWAKTNMTRLRGWAPRGHKLLADTSMPVWPSLTPALFAQTVPATAAAAIITTWAYKRPQRARI